MPAHPDVVAMLEQHKSKDRRLLDTFVKAINKRFPALRCVVTVQVGACCIRVHPATPALARQMRQVIHSDAFREWVYGALAALEAASGKEESERMTAAPVIDKIMKLIRDAEDEDAHIYVHTSGGHFMITGVFPNEMGEVCLIGKEIEEEEQDETGDNEESPVDD
jgi:hypothetical protein